MTNNILSFKDKKSDPVFIIGAQRSGTTLLRLMLNAHSQIAIPEEGTFWMPLLRKYGKNPNRKISRKQFKSHIKYIIANRQFNLWDLSDDCISSLQYEQCQDLCSMFRALYKIYADRQGKKIWGDKTPSFFRMVPVLAKVVPDARFIHIIRDGRDLHLSWKKMDPSKGNLAVGALEWQHKVQSAQKALQSYATNRYLELRYEDLINNAEDSLKSICLFLSIDFEPTMLNYWQKSHDYIGDHHSKLIFKPLSSSSVCKWKNEMSEKELDIFNMIAGDCLAANGYEYAGKKTSTIALRSISMLTYGLPARAMQVLLVMLKLWGAARFGLATSASGCGDRK